MKTQRKLKSAMKSKGRRPALPNRTHDEPRQSPYKQFLELLPPSSMESDAELEASLCRYKQRSPILRHLGRIVDGHRRLRILAKIGMKPWIVDIDLTPVPNGAGRAVEPDVACRSYFEINSCRRELNDAVRAALADALATMKKGDNQHTAVAAGGLSRESAAKLARSSVDSIERWRFIKDHPKARMKALSGEWSLSHAKRAVEGEALAKKAKKHANKRGDMKVLLNQLVAEAATFSVMYLDPPWSYNQDTGEPTSAADPRRHYGTMPLEVIKALPVDKLANRDSVIYLWSPSSLERDAMDCLEKWGFKFVCSVIWAKPTAPPTQGVIQPHHEVLLVGKRGVGVLNEKRQMPSVHFAPVPDGVHSRKPAWFIEQLDRIYPEMAKVELFCRQPRKGWVSLGNHPGVVAAPGGRAANDATKSTKSTKSTKTTKSTSRPSSRCRKAA